jgi:hypothetical protein
MGEIGEIVEIATILVSEALKTKTKYSFTI